MASSDYTTKKHSTFLKNFATKMDEIEKIKEKELIFNILLPVHKMQNDIYNLTSEYAEFTENKESLTFLNQLDVFNEIIIQILNNEPINYGKLQNGHTTTTENGNNNNNESNGDNNNNNNNNDENSNESSNNNNNHGPEMALHELIDILVLTDIRPIEYDKELLVNLLISSDITNQNVVEKKELMISILEDCKFPRNRAEFTTDQIMRNLAQQQLQSESQTETVTSQPLQCVAVNQATNHQSTAVEANGNGNVDNNNNNNNEEDEDLKNIVDLTELAMDGIFGGDLHYNRQDIIRLYRLNDITSDKISFMTEVDFSKMFTKLNSYQSITKPNCVKIHRAIKSFLNVSQKKRYDIDIGLAIIYLINEDNIFTPKEISIKPDAIIAAFKSYSAKKILNMGKKSFIKILQTQTHIKMGHGTKLWQSIKSFIEDSNANVPQQIIIKDYNDSDDEQQQQNGGGDNVQHRKENEDEEEENNDNNGNETDKNIQDPNDEDYRNQEDVNKIDNMEPVTV